VLFWNFFLMIVFPFNLMELLNEVLVFSVVFVRVQAVWLQKYRKEVGMTSWTWQPR
jgi:riboflavin transporter FmnP